ncbi:MAG: Energy-conserving hydrogenase (ferredoxin), subunit B [Anaerolineae bacterium]|nr:MAG: Energy-conserving hydrogenase (ferredoxin), subunit B [Anaerolineae bacterium]
MFSWFALLIFPGFLYAVPMGWLMLWLERKILARLQSRIGPPFYQPFFDFIKLMSKEPFPRPRGEDLFYLVLPLLALGATLGSLTLLPIFAGSSAAVGDLVLFIALIEVAPICLVLLGFLSRSIFGQVGAIREATLTIATNLPFITALIALAYASGSLRLSEIAANAPSFVRLFALLALLFCLPIKLRLNPFSVANAEQEIYQGALTELDGWRLGLWELVHAVEWVALSGLIVCLVSPWRSGAAILDASLFALLSLVLVVVLTAVAGATARLKLLQASRLYWRWGFGLAILALVVSFFPFGG